MNLRICIIVIMLVGFCPIKAQAAMYLLIYKKSRDSISKSYREWIDAADDAAAQTEANRILGTITDETDAKLFSIGTDIGLS